MYCRSVAIASQFREKSAVDRCKEDLYGCGSEDRVLSISITFLPPTLPESLGNHLLPGSFWGAQETPSTLTVGPLFSKAVM
jgi:hypothetical protein